MFLAHHCVGGRGQNAVCVRLCPSANARAVEVHILGMLTKASTGKWVLNGPVCAPTWEQFLSSIGLRASVCLAPLLPPLLP